MKKLLTILILITFLSGSKVAAQSTLIKPGIVLPQMTTAQRNALSATDGMLIFDTNTQSYWLRSSGAWTELPKTAANTNFWKQTGLGGNEIKNTNSGGFWFDDPTGLDDNATNITNPPTAPVSGVGTRLMWIPSRSAFRVGTITGTFTTWDAARIGLFSTATGLNTEANGTISTAIGQYTEARGNVSTAMGRLTTAIGFCSTAMGSYTIASGNYSTAMGFNNVDNPNGLLMIGNGTGTPKTVFIITKDNSRVGIGTETPLAPLHVAGESTINGSVSGRYFNYASAVNTITSYVGVEYPSILADASIITNTTFLAFQSIAASDYRIKNIIGISDNAQDLAKIKKIEITDYTMKDVGTWGNQRFKKVIAQQVESVYPEIVSKQTKVIPDIYALAEKVGYDTATKELKCLLSKSYDIKVGDKIELVHPEKGKIQAVVASVSGNEFTVKDWLYATDKIFVFGREVNDFRTVDYDALSMLGISAIQQLAKEVTDLRGMNNDLLMRLDKLETLEKRLNATEANLSHSKENIKLKLIVK